MTAGCTTSRELGLAHLTIEEATPEELVSVAAAAGFSAVGMRICGFSPETDNVGLLGNRQRQRALRHQMDASGIRLLNVCSFRLTDAIRTDNYAAVIEACVELGAPVILLTCFIDDVLAREDRLGALAEKAGHAGLSVGLEFFRSSSLRTLPEADALQRRHAGNVGHVLDALHFFRAGHVVPDLSGLDHLAIFGIQICDGPEHAPAADLLRAEIRDRLLPGDGELPLEPFVAALPRHLTLEIEAPMRAFERWPFNERARRARRAGVAFLEKLEQRIRE